jgi:methanogenic corrinoid protein MtbC1
MRRTRRHSQLISAIADLNEGLALSLTRKLLAENSDPITLILHCQEGLHQVGKRYAERKYFLSGLIMGGEIFYEVMELIKPVMETQITGTSSGTMLLGTVEGDIHDLGKNIVKLLLSCYKIDVVDLGVDVPPEEFLRQAHKIRPDILGLSGLITKAADSMRETVRLFRKDGYDIPIIIGGSQLGVEMYQYTGADYWVNDANKGLELCLRLLSK